jgi:hypothetical protein
VNGRNSVSALLRTDVYTATGGKRTFRFAHNYNFEINLFGGAFDGDILFANINGADFAPVTPAVARVHLN